MGDFFNSVGTGIENAFSSASEGIGGLFEPDKPFGSSVDPSKAEYDIGTGAPENLEAIRLDAEYGDEGEPLNESAVTMEKLYDEWEAKEDSKSKWDSKKASGALSKLGSTSGGSPQVIGKTGSLPGVDLTEARAKGYRPTDSLYAPPSYLQGSQAYNAQVAKLVQTLLGRQIRAPRISSLV